MLFGADWLANLYMGCFLFGLIFTALSLFLSMGSLGGGHLHLPHIGHGSHVHLPTPHLHGPGAHGPNVHGPGAHGPGHTPGGHLDALNLSEQIGSLSPLNIPTIMAFVTWFGGAGYLLRTDFGLDGVLTMFLALVSGLVGGSILFVILSRVIWAGQTTPMRRADYYLPGTQARVVSSIAVGGTGEIVFQKSGFRRVEGARAEKGQAIAKGTDVLIVRYEKGLAYVQPLPAGAGEVPVLARVDRELDSNTQPLGSNGPALTQDLRNQP